MYDLPQHSTHHLSVSSQFIPPHSHTHHNHASAPANSHETRRHRDRNESHNAVNMEKRFEYKDSKYSRADNENIMDFIVQYDLVSRYFNLSHHKKRQYTQNLFHEEALRYYYGEVEPLGNNYADVIAKIQSQFNSIYKQQCVKAEVYGLSFQDMVHKCDGDRRKALRDLVATIEARILQQNKSNKFDFLGNALLAEDWARQLLYSIGKGTHFSELTTQLASALQVHEEALARSRCIKFVWIEAYDILHSAEVCQESVEETIPWIRSRSLLTKLRTNWTSTSSRQEATKSCRYCRKKAEFLKKRRTAAMVASAYSTNWRKDPKIASTSNLLTPKILLLLTSLMHQMRDLIRTLSLRTSNPSRK